MLISYFGAEDRISNTPSVVKSWNHLPCINTSILDLVTAFMSKFFSQCSTISHAEVGGPARQYPLLIPLFHLEIMEVCAQSLSKNVSNGNKVCVGPSNATAEAKPIRTLNCKCNSKHCQCMSHRTRRIPANVCINSPPQKKIASSNLETDQRS